MPAIVIPDDFPSVMGPSVAYGHFTAKQPVTYFDSLPGSEDALIERIRDFEIVINIRSSTKFTERVFAACPRMRLLSLWGTGTDNVDLAAAQDHGVTVTNTPCVSAIAIAEHSLMLALAVACRVIRVHEQFVQGQWPRGQAVQLYGKTLGIIGVGAIGSRFAALGQAVGMNVIAWTMHPNPALGFRLAEVDQLLAQSDVISLHLPGCTGYRAASARSSTHSIRKCRADAALRPCLARGARGRSCARACERGQLPLRHSAQRCPDVS